MIALAIATAYGLVASVTCGVMRFYTRNWEDKHDSAGLSFLAGALWPLAVAGLVIANAGRIVERKLLAREERKQLPAARVVR